MTSKPIKLSSLKADLDREKNGDWVAYPDWPGVEFNVSSLHKPSYVTARDLMMKRLARTYMGADIPAEVLTKELGILYASEILHNWRGLDETYTPERAREILCDAAYREVVRAVEYCAGRVSQLHVEWLDTATKNSVRPSSGA